MTLCFTVPQLRFEFITSDFFQALFIETKKKGEDYGLPSSYQVLSEMSEPTKTFTQDPKVTLKNIYIVGNPIMA